MDLKNGLGHLSYSTLVHAGDTWEEMNASLREFVPQVKQQISPDQPFAVSLRISSASAKTLSESAVEREALKDFLIQEDLYVYTVNAFPYGPFKGDIVMERVYEPDWTSEERVSYTNSVADILAEVSPANVNPSIQTAPLAFRPNVANEQYVKTFTRNIFRVVKHLRELEERTGRRVKLAIEPEPACYLETTDETVTYFKERIYSLAGIRELAEVAGIPLSEAEGAVRRYLGVVFDIGHQSVGFENITESLTKLVEAGIPIFKLQAAASLWVENLTRDKLEALRRFTETIYLSQTSLKQNGEITKYLHLGEALDAYEANPVASEMRTHFHVPVFLEELGPFRTTRFGVQEALKMHRKSPLSDHLEIETYTWDVLPEELKTGNIIDYVNSELEFVRTELIG
ncbi:unannotated protein [freshwater metagenome]|uniref:Unannotated protein n=1 Tax=freshwater metagenome TaxID=449393 RepID=A0A6J7K387_9ZZZZ|nr:metabolite traffic protein EboE [Actinomycetota bacterium]